MGLFRRKNRVENIILPENNALEEKQEEIKLEEEKEVEDKFELPLGYEAKQKEIAKIYKRATNLLNALVIQFYMCKFFAPAVLLTDSENYIIVSLERQIIRIKDENFVINKKVEHVLSNIDIADEYFYEVYYDIKGLEDKIDGLLTNMEETKREYYNSLKVSSLAMILNKKADELEKFDKRLTKFLNEFKDLSEASDYIYLNSGKLITSLINSLVRCIEGTNNKDQIQRYNYYYFLKSDAILCLEVSEWIELFNKLTHVMHVVKRVDISNYVDFQNYLQEFEIRYLILMIEEEKKNYRR